MNNLNSDYNNNNYNSNSRSNNMYEDSKEHKLGWIKVLYDYRVPIDVEAFSKWDRNDMEIPNKIVLENDIPRTRFNRQQMKKEAFRDVLRRIATFYCKSNGISYQQGLLEVVYPFACLRRKDFPTKKCYAYFSAFMRKHFPKVLIQRIVKEKKQLPHIMLALNLTECLLNYHYPSIAYKLKQSEVEMNQIATQELMTVFTKGLEMELVYKMYEFLIGKNNQNYMFYMMIALFGIQEEQIQEAIASDEILRYVQTFKKISNHDQLTKWLQLAEQIEKNTPQSFIHLSESLRFQNKNILTEEELIAMLRMSQSMIEGGFLPISTSQVQQNPDQYTFVLLNNKIKHKNLRFITIEKEEKGDASKFSTQHKYVLALHEGNRKTELQLLKKYVQQVCENENFHFMLLKQQLVEEKGKCRTF